MTPPTVAARSLVGKCEDALIKALSESAEFQSFCGVSTVSGALAKIYLTELPSPADKAEDEYESDEFADYWPGAVIYEGEDGEGASSFMQTSTGPGYNLNLAFTIQFRKLRDSADTNTNANRKMKDSCQLILEEIIGRSGSNSSIFYATETSSSNPWIPDAENNQDPYMMMEIMLSRVIEE